MKKLPKNKNRQKVQNKNVKIDFFVTRLICCVKKVTFWHIPRNLKRRQEVTLTVSLTTAIIKHSFLTHLLIIIIKIKRSNTLRMHQMPNPTYFDRIGHWRHFPVIVVDRKYVICTRVVYGC